MTHPLALFQFDAIDGKAILIAIYKSTFCHNYHKSYTYGKKSSVFYYRNSKVVRIKGEREGILFSDNYFFAVDYIKTFL